MRTAALLGIGIAAGLAGGARGDESPAAPATAGAPARPRVEVAFVLDTTGSMSGLIETAKAKIWAIANDVARVKPAPEIRMGLVAYRDRGDEYVTRVTDLSQDLDHVYADLVALRADGGGDGPENVNRALHDAITKLAWSREERVLRVVFLVGDAPPHMDYAEEVPYAKTCEEAARAGIVVNTLRCGGDPETERVWTEIARLAEGRYASIPQEGSEAVATPFDGRVAELGSAMAGTYVGYGDDGVRREAVRKMSAAESAAGAAAPAEAPKAVAADRAGLMARTGRLDASDLLSLLAEGNTRLEDLDEAKLPADLKALKPEDRRAWIEAKAKEREALRKELSDLESKRAAFLAEAARKAASAGRSAFDLEVSKFLREQAVRKGFKFE
jgi:uncharacterized protein YegL